VGRFGRSNEHEVQLWILKILSRGGKLLERCFLLAEGPYHKSEFLYFENEAWMRTS